MKQFYFILLLLGSSLGVFGQGQVVLSGTVTDEAGQALEYADVMLLHPTDSSMIEYAMVKDGHFALEAVAAGNYLLTVIALSYENYYQTISLQKEEQLKVQLEERAEQLDGVTVTATRNTIVNKNGNLKMTIGNSAFAAQSSPLDVLALLPGVQIASDRSSLSIIGKGAPLIYLDNRRISIDELNSMPVESIKDVEIINNPSARYEANGRVVLLITRKLNFSDGIRLGLTETASFKRRFSNYAGLTASLKKNKLEVRSNFAFNQLQPWEGLDGLLTILDRDVSLNRSSVSVGQRPQFIIGGGIHYQLNDGDYLSANVNLRAHTTEAPLRTGSSLQEGTRTNTIETLSNEKGDREFFTSNVNFNKKLRPIDGNLFVGLQYSSYFRGLKSSINNSYDQQDFVLEQIRDQGYEINAFATRIDFEKKFSKAIRGELGTNIYRADADAFTNFELLGSGETQETFYDYKERNYAAYIQFSGQLGRLDYSMGLRSETTTVEGQFRDANELVVDRNRTVLFPRAIVNVEIDSSKSLSFNFIKSIRRPSYLDASSITTYLHPFLEYSRNANLQSTINNEVSVNFQYKNQSIKVGYHRQEYPVFRSVMYQAQEGRILMSPENFDSESGFDISITNPLRYKFWSITNFAKLSFSKVKYTKAVVTESKPYLYLYSNHQFRLPKSTRLGVIFWGLTPRKEGVFERNSLFVVGASVTKTFFGKLQVSFNVNDLFRAMEFREAYQVNGVQADDVFYGDVKEFAVSLRYSFGKISKSTYQNKDVDENINRMK